MRSGDLCSRSVHGIGFKASLRPLCIRPVSTGMRAVTGIALFVVGYLAIALACCYLEGLLTGEAVPPLWLMWPIMLPVYLVAWLFSAVGDLGERHSK